MQKTKLKQTEFLANYLGITPRRIRQLANEGIIPSKKIEGAYYFDAPIAIKKYISYLQEYLNRPEDYEEQEIQKLVAETRIINAKADIEEMRMHDKLSKLHYSEDVKKLLQDLHNVIQAKITKLPNILANECAKLKTPAEISERIEKECFKILTELSRYTYKG